MCGITSIQLKPTDALAMWLGLLNPTWTYNFNFKVVSEATGNKLGLVIHNSNI